MQILGTLASVACLIPLILVVIKMFQAKGPLHGILGIICGLYAFIWGWMNAEQQGLKKVMIIWTVLIIVSIALNGMTAMTLQSVE